MKKVILFFVFIFLPFLTFSQCSTPVATLSYISTSGSNCTYSLTLQLTITDAAVKWVNFTFQGTMYCYKSTGGSVFVLDNTCGGPGNQGSNNTSPSTASVTITFTQPCTTALPAATYTARNSATNNGNNACTGTFTINAPFPLKLKSFESNATNQQIDLKWATSNEINFDKFEIQKSFDAKSFENIGTLKSELENHNYFFSDIFPKIGQNYYRLKMLDLDGSFTYSKIINEVFIPNNSPAYNVFPNPSKNKKIIIKQNLTKDQIKIYTISGQIIDFEVNANELFTEIFLKNNLNQNEIFVNYFLNQKLYTEKVILE